MTVKAGPKKKRAKSEADLIRAAVDDNARRTKTVKKSSRVRSYSYKETDQQKRRRVDKFWRQKEMEFGLREPAPLSPYQQYRESLDPEQRVFARLYWQMLCSHESATAIVEKASFVAGNEVHFIECQECNATIRWHGTKTATKLMEWVSYCPDDFDMFDWQEMYVKDRQLWPIIHDETLAEQQEGVEL